MKITVEVLETASVVRKSAELRILFPNSAAIAFESRGHGGRSVGAMAVFVHPLPLSLFF